MRLEQLITGNDEVQQHIASEREKQGLVAVSPKARQAIKLEVLPQIEESVISVEAAEGLCEETKQAIEAAFSFKNQLYTRLVSHKGIEQGDGQYLADLLIVMDEWLRNTKANLKGDEEEDREKVESKGNPDSDKKEVEITVKVEQVAPETGNTVQLKETDRGPNIDVDPAALFDLADVRL